MNVLVVVPSVRAENVDNVAQQYAALAEIDFCYCLVANSDAVRARADAKAIPFVTRHRNLGFAASVNLAASQHEKWDLLVVLNDDFVLGHELEGLRAELDTMSTRSIRFLSAQPWRRIPTVADVVLDVALLRSIYSRIRGARDVDSSPSGRRGYKSFAFAAIGRAVWDDLGGMNTEFPFTYEDAHFVSRAHERGHEVTASDRDFGVHLHSQSTRSFIDMVLPVTAWSASVYLTTVGVGSARARALCMLGLVLRIALVPWASGPSRPHLRGIGRGVSSLIRGSQPGLPDYESLGRTA